LRAEVVVNDPDFAIENPYQAPKAGLAREAPVDDVPEGTYVRRFKRDPTGLTQFLLFCLCVMVAIDGLSFITHVARPSTAQGVAAGEEEISVSDLVEVLLAMAQVLAMLVTGVVFLKWIYRANLNVRGFGAQGLNFTPGWSIGWYFIPIANLWKPYQAMSEIWRASRDPRNWKREPGSAVLNWWWAFWIFSSIANNAQFRLGMRAESAAALEGVRYLTIGTDVIDIILALLAITLIRRIIAMQRAWVNGPEKPTATDRGLAY
jgi:Domain of unknown function (DUF4328)